MKKLLAVTLALLTSTASAEEYVYSRAIGITSIVVSGFLFRQARKTRKEANELNLNEWLTWENNGREYQRKRTRAKHMASLATLLLMNGTVLTIIGYSIKVEPDRIAMAKDWRF